MCESKDHMNKGCGCANDAASGKMEEGKHKMKDACERGKEAVKDMAESVSDKAKSMMDKEKNYSLILLEENVQPTAYLITQFSISLLIY